MGVNLDKLAVGIIDCGGAKQVVKQYLNLRELTALPIVCLLDSDVQEHAEIISDSLRESDRLITLSQKEIEDTFLEPSFLRLMQLYMAQRSSHLTDAPLTLEELALNDTHENGRTAVMDRLLKARGLGPFDKIGFATVAAQNLTAAEIPNDVKKVVNKLVEIHNDGIKFRFAQK